MPAFTSLLIGSLLLTGAHVSFAPEYVALGDSYAAGVGTPGSSGHCGQSPQAYPALYAEQQHFPVARSAACSGASTADVIDSQLDALDPGTSLVTITIGGNDVGFAGVMTSCVLGSDSACADKVHQAEDVVTGPLGGNLANTFAAIHQKAPNAKLVVLGYPHLVEADGPCSLSIAKRKVLNEGSDQLADVLREQATNAGAEFLDARPAFAGHGYCSADAWINGVNLLNVSGSFHPDVDGQRLGYLPLLTG